MKDLGKDEVTQTLNNFSCENNFDVQDFLLNPAKAIRFEQTDNARTYLILDNETGLILAYFSVSFKDLTLNEIDISKTLIKNLDGISKNATRIRAFLIGQIGKNFNIPNNPVKLTYILDEIYAVLFEVRNLIGGRIIILECEDNPKLIQLYEKNGFKLFDIKNETPPPKLRTMFTFIKDTEQYITS